MGHVNDPMKQHLNHHEQASSAESEGFAVHLPVQTRSEETGMEYYPDVSHAMEAAKKDPTIWKISFKHEGDRIRLVRKGEGWMYQPLMEEVQRVLTEEDARHEHTSLEHPEQHGFERAEPACELDAASDC